MTALRRAIDTRSLVDGELLTALDGFPPIKVGTETLTAIRQAMAQPRPGADPAQLYPSVSCVEHRVPGADGDPEIRVLRYSDPGRTTPTAALLWMHGGGFVFGTAEMDATFCRRLVALTGLAVIAVDYRLAPETRAPGPLNDCYAALAWVCARADVLGVDRSRLAVGGASAGGGLAASLALMARDRGAVPVAYQLLIYPMLDDRTATPTGWAESSSPYVGEFVWTRADNLFGWTSLLGHRPGADDVSPYAAAGRADDVAGLPPAFICVGSLDLFAEEDIAYATRLLRAGVPVELHVYPGGFHGFDMAVDARVTVAHSRNIVSALDRWVNG